MHRKNKYIVCYNSDKCYEEKHRKFFSGSVGVGVRDLNIVAKDDLSKKLIFEKIPEGDEGVFQAPEMSSAKARRWEST